ncbi:hypothetical protein RCO48_33215 [Peribacillus frigoritolerans]|nr:hypothetical protein [Peribacillus frigoritolerans]
MICSIKRTLMKKITLAGHRLDDTVTKVENVDRQLVEEYDVSVGQENVAVGLFRALLDATKQDGHVFADDVRSIGIQEQ